MEVEPEILSEMVCEGAEKVPWKKVLQGVRGAVVAAAEDCHKSVTGRPGAVVVCGKASSTEARESLMEVFSENDVKNLQEAKDALFEKAKAGDGIAGQGAAALLQAEIAGKRLAMEATALDLAAVKAAGAPAPGSWQETVRQPEGAPVLTA
jgi:hypothetical protein